MGDLITNTNVRDGAVDADLPPFITASGIAEKLNWAPSLQRLFRQHVQSHSVPGWTIADGDLYPSIYELMRLPGGLAFFENRVADFDSKRGRGLLRALFEAGSRQLSPDLKTRPRSSFALMSTMIRQEKWDLAAWMAWSQLEIPGLKGERDGAATVDELVDSHKELALRLGEYWTQKGWLRGSGDEAETPTSPAAAGEVAEGAFLELRWREELDDLVHRLSKATIGRDLTHELAGTGERLGVLNRQWAELGAISLQGLRGMALAALTDALQAAEPQLSAAGSRTEGFVDIVAQQLGTDDPERIDMVEAAAKQLRSLAEDARIAASVEDEAKAAHAREDSDAADTAYAIARGRRRKTTQALIAFVDSRLPRLISGEPLGSEEGAGATADLITVEADDDLHHADAELVVSSDANAGSQSLESVVEEVAIATGYGSGAEAPEIGAETKAAESREPEGSLPEATKLAVMELVASVPQEIPAHPPTDLQDGPIEAAVTEALITKRFGLAYHLAAAAEARGLGVDLAPPAILEALAVGAAASGLQLIPAATRYKTLQEKVLLAMDASSTPATRLTVFAGALKPALFAPDSSGVEILGRANLGEYGAGLHELCQFVTTEIRGRGLNLTPADFEPATADGDRRAAEEAARKALLDFATTAPSRKLKFHRAITIWTDVFRQGPVADAITAIEAKAKNAPALAKAAEEWIYEDTAEHRVDLLDVHHRSRKDRPLEAGVRLRLADWLRQTAQHLRHWVEAHDARERTGGEHVLEKLHELRSHLKAAQADLESVASSRPHLRAPAMAAADVVNDLLARSGDAAETPLTIEMALNDDLLLFDPPILRRGAHEGSAEEAEIIVRQGPAIAAAIPDFEAAFHAAIRAGRFAAARSILGRLVVAGAALAPLEQALNTSAETWSTETVNRAERLRGRIDDLLGADQLALIDVGLSTRLDSLLTALRAPSGEEDTQFDFSELNTQLNDIEADVRNGFEILLVPLRQRIEELKARGRDTGELEEMAEHHDLATLAEHIDAALNDVDWTAKRAGGLLERFANHSLTEEYERTPPNDRSVAELIRAAEGRRRTPAADFSGLDEGEANRARELLMAWRDLRNPPARRELALARLMEALGFASAEVKDNGALGKAQGAPRRMTLHTNKIADREICRVPAFGSEANGRYEIILAEPSAVKTGEELTGWLEQLPAATTTPTFVVVAGHLSLKSRNLFMSAVRRRGGSASYGLIDEAMVVFLAAQPDRRRGHLFDLALPMGLVQPYADTAARTSQEMFYGRKSELDDLWDRNGSCLVYGGRQLGKTALLKQIQLRHNQPPTQLVIYGDLQAELPGANGNNIWPWLGRKLKGEPGFANRDMKSQAEVEDAIRAWLASDSRRRLLVLVDEADEFLRQELVNQYTSLAKIRDLMRATDRYCKFVFAGLHDVQRLARTPNSPLLHFGAPVRVGPLMGSDLPEARAMAEGPMAAAGFVFKSPSLTGRMLSQVGYYPSLLQAFAKGLIERMNKSIGRRMAAAGNSLVPLVVTERDLEETFQDRAFRDNIQLKFENTLNLDERYRLITFVMLIDSLARRDRGVLPIGLKDAEVQRLALQWWPQGFAEDQSLDAFQGLLQEMIGLGVLIEQADGRFVIRSARIADMLGGREQIERKLVELSDKEAPSRLDTGALRRQCGPTPSPLTARQETMLLSEARPASAVHLLASSRALGIDQVATSLSDIAETRVRIDQRSYMNLRQLEQAVDAAATSVVQKERGLLVLSGPWLGAEMMVLAARHTRVRQAQKDGRYGIRVLLVPYEVDWRELDAVVDGDAIVSLSPLGESSLGQFIKRHWGRSLGAQADEGQIKEIHRLTGGFPRFLHQPKGRTMAEMIETLRQLTEDLYQSPDLFELLGVTDDALMTAVTVVGELGYHGEASDDLMRGEGIDNPQGALRQLERLGIVERHASEQSYEAEHRLNPFVAAALVRRKG
jgi:hypothetical protein